MKVSRNRSQATDGTGLNFGIFPAPPWRKWSGDDDPDRRKDLDILGLRPGNRLGNGRSRQWATAGRHSRPCGMVGKFIILPRLPSTRGWPVSAKAPPDSYPGPNPIQDEGRHRFSCRLGFPDRRVNQPYPLDGDRPLLVVVFTPGFRGLRPGSGPPQILSAPTASALPLILRGQVRWVALSGSTCCIQ